MPITNTLLVRAAYGWDEVTRPSSIATYGRRESLYGLGANASPADVVRTANGRLDIIATPRFQYDAEQQPPTDAQLAYHGYGVGDTLPMTVAAGSVTERVISIAVSEDDKSGQATVTPSLHDVVMYASPIENFVAMLGQAVKKMIPGTGRGDWKEAQPVTPPAIPAPVSAWVPPVVSCITESFDGADSDTLVGYDLTWTTWKFANMHGSFGNFSGSDTNGSKIACIRDNHLTLVAPTSLDGTLANTPTLPTQAIACYNRADSDLATDDMAVTATIAGMGPLGTGAGKFTGNTWQVIARAQNDTWSDGSTSGWIFEADVYSFSGGVQEFYLYCIAPAGSQHTAASDTSDPAITIAPGDTLSVTVTGTGAATRVVCKWNATTVFDFAGTDLTNFCTAHSLDPDTDLPVGVRGGVGLQAAPHSNSGAYWTTSHDDTVTLDDFSVCPA